MKLTPLENTWAIAALGAIFPGSSDGGLADIGAMDIAGFLAGVMRRLPFRAALGLRVAVWVAALAPFFAAGRLATIAGLRPAERENVMAKLFVSRWYALRSLMMILKTFGALLYAGDAAVRARLTASPQQSLVALRLNRAGVTP
jgi:hypothetical protein